MTQYQGDERTYSFPKWLLKYFPALQLLQIPCLGTHSCSLHYHCQLPRRKAQEGEALLHITPFMNSALNLLIPSSTSVTAKTSLSVYEFISHHPGPHLGWKLPSLQLSCMMNVLSRAQLPPKVSHYIGVHQMQIKIIDRDTFARINKKRKGENCSPEK